MMANFKKYYFTKEAFEKVGLDIDKPYGLVHFIRPLMSLFDVDGLAVSYSEMVKMLKGNLRQTWLDEGKNTNHYLFLEHDKVDGNTYYIVNKNFDWDWYKKDTIEQQSKVYETADEARKALNQNDELDLLRYITRLLLKNNADLPFEINSALSMWNERFNK